MVDVVFLSMQANCLIFNSCLASRGSPWIQMNLRKKDLAFQKAFSMTFPKWGDESVRGCIKLTTINKAYELINSTSQEIIKS